MSNLYIGTSKLKNLYVGASKAKKIYMGTTMVWQSAIPVAKPTQLSPSGTYSGSTITNGYTMPSGVTMTGSASGTNAGTYTAVYTPDADHVWSDTEDRTPVTVTLTIGRASVGAKPTTAVSKDYNGSAQSNGYTKPNGVNMTGSASGTNGGTYSAIYTPDSNHKWSDNTTGAVIVTLTINYAWTKWNVNLSYVDTAQSISVPANTTGKVLVNGTFTQYYKKATQYSFNTSSGIYTPTGGTEGSITSGNIVIAEDDNPNYFGLVGDASKWLYVVAAANTSNISVSTYNEKIVASNYGTVAKTVELRSAVANYSKGSTNLETVRSTNINAYPQNGTPDNTNWYVKNW